MAKKMLVLCCLFFVIFFSQGFCTEVFIPASGTWKGENISFFVSKDSSKLTAINSTIKNNISNNISNDAIKDVRFSLTVMAKSNGFVNTMSITADIPINNGRFVYKKRGSGYSFSIKGKFTAANLATGTASLSQGANSGIVYWTAKPDPTAVDQESNLETGE